LLVLPFWEKDKVQAMTLARLIADIEPRHSDLADFLFVNRFDCEQDPATVKYVSRKFNTFTYRSPRQSVGWPRGCNGLFFGAAEYYFHMSAEDKKTPRYKAAFFMEGDCVPFKRDWISFFSKEWDSFGGKAMIAGKTIKTPEIREHINGNCFVSGDMKFLHYFVKRMGEPAHVGWDYGFAEQLRALGVRDMPGMQCLWNTPTMTEEQLYKQVAEGVVWLHGVKDYSALNFAKRLLFK
jgi:hypothetical protein